MSRWFLGLGLAFFAGCTSDPSSTCESGGCDTEPDSDGHDPHVVEVSTFAWDITGSVWTYTSETFGWADSLTLDIAGPEEWTEFHTFEAGTPSATEESFALTLTVVEDAALVTEATTLFTEADTTGLVWTVSAWREDLLADCIVVGGGASAPEVEEPCRLLDSR